MFAPTLLIAALRFSTIWMVRATIITIRWWRFTVFYILILFYAMCHGWRISGLRWMNLLNLLLNSGNARGYIRKKILQMFFSSWLKDVISLCKNFRTSIFTHRIPDILLFVFKNIFFYTFLAEERHVIIFCRLSFLSKCDHLTRWGMTNICNWRYCHNRFGIRKRHLMLKLMTWFLCINFQSFRRLIRETFWRIFHLCLKRN